MRCKFGCGVKNLLVKLPKINFKFHQQIFHSTAKLAPHPIAICPNPAPSLRQAKVPCAHCNLKIKKHDMVRHVKNVHGKNADVGQSEHEVVGVDENMDASIPSEVVSGEEDVAMG